MPLRSPFTPDWPRFAVATHVLFWSLSALFLSSCLAAYMGLVGGQMVVSLFWAMLVAGFLLGMSGAVSGRLYLGHQVFRRTPLTGWPARVYGLAVSGSTGLLMLFRYALLRW